MVHLVVPCQGRGTASSAVFQQDKSSPNPEHGCPAACVGDTLGPTSLVVDAPQLQECLILYIKYLVIYFSHLGAVDGPRAAGKDQSCSKQRVFTRPQVWMPS